MFALRVMARPRLPTLEREGRKRRRRRRWWLWLLLLWLLLLLLFLLLSTVVTSVMALALVMTTIRCCSYQSSKYRGCVYMEGRCVVAVLRGCVCVMWHLSSSVARRSSWRGAAGRTLTSAQSLPPPPHCRALVLVPPLSHVLRPPPVLSVEKRRGHIAS